MSRLLLLALLLAACSGLGGPQPIVGAQAPDFSLPDLDGQMVSLRDLRGQNVLLNFWATWCLPCRDEMPAIQARYNDGGFAVLAVDFGESRQQVTGFLEQIGVQLPVALDEDGRVQELYRVRGYPTTFFIDRRGVIRAMHIGQMSEADIDRYLRELDAQP